MRALVTGSAGFLGRHFRDALHDQGHEVHQLDTRYGEASDVRLLPPTEGGSYYDLVIHCAGLVDGRETIEHKAALLGAYNLQLDGALFEWALKARPGRVVYLSSSAAYPVHLQSAPVALRECDMEGAFANPDNTYGWVKLTGERIAAEVAKAGVPVTIIRPFSGYGSDQDYRYPFPAMIERAERHANPFVIWGDGRQVRDFIHVDDIVGATLALVEAEVDGPVNLGTGIPTSMNDLALRCVREAGYLPPFSHLLDKPVGVHYRVADTTLLRRYYEPRVTLQEGIRRALTIATGLQRG